VNTFARRKNSVFTLIKINCWSFLFTVLLAANGVIRHF
jgi:hypothetical protein